MTSINETIFEVLADINSCAYWLNSMYLCNPDGTEISDEDLNGFDNAIKARYGKDYEICREDVWMEGLQNGYPLKVIPYDDEPVYVDFPKLAKACVGVDIDSRSFDGLVVDAAFQRACFGKVVYG